TGGGAWWTYQVSVKGIVHSQPPRTLAVPRDAPCRVAVLVFATCRERVCGVYGRASCSAAPQATFSPGRRLSRVAASAARATLRCSRRVAPPPTAKRIVSRLKPCDRNRPTLISRSGPVRRLKVSSPSALRAAWLYPSCSANSTGLPRSTPSGTARPNASHSFGNWGATSDHVEELKPTRKETGR